MTFDEFVEHMREEIREEGFLSATQIVPRIFVRAKEQNCKYDWERVVEAIPCGNIRVVEYANKLTAGYRRKNLFYFNPD